MIAVSDYKSEYATIVMQIDVSFVLIGCIGKLSRVETLLRHIGFGMEQ